MKVTEDASWDLKNMVKIFGLGNIRKNIQFINEDICVVFQFVICFMSSSFPNYTFSICFIFSYLGTVGKNG
jgi:hypothetical protein